LHITFTLRQTGALIRVISARGMDGIPFNIRAQLLAQSLLSH
jgi:hypothetical protein